MRAVAGYVRLAVVSAAITALFVLAVPDHTSVALRIETFVLVAIAVMAIVGVLTARTPLPPPSPFRPGKRKPSPPPVPASLERHAVELRATVSAPQPSPLPGALRRTMMAIAASRLAEHHGILLEDESTADLARGLCGEPLWQALNGRPVDVDPDELISALERL
jgi:hypothetical protein